jgi:hypothetical protein
MRIMDTAMRVMCVAVLLLAFLIGSRSTPTAQQMEMLGLWGTSAPTVAGTPVINQVPVSTTVTARNVAGALFVEKSSRWTVVSFPASGSQGTASLAAEAGVRHVIDCVSFAGDSSAAVTAAAGNVAIRDGATGAGTVIWQAAIAHLVAAGAGVQTIAASSVCGLNLVGTTNTAMTAEFNAGVTGEVQSVSISGYNVGS